jgi:hypothetical protein
MTPHHSKHKTNQSGRLPTVEVSTIVDLRLFNSRGCEGALEPNVDALEKLGQHLLADEILQQTENRSVSVERECWALACQIPRPETS